MERERLAQLYTEALRKKDQLLELFQDRKKKLESLGDKQENERKQVIRDLETAAFWLRNFDIRIFLLENVLFIPTPRHSCCQLLDNREFRNPFATSGRRVTVGIEPAFCKDGNN